MTCYSMRLLLSYSFILSIDFWLFTYPNDFYLSGSASQLSYTSSAQQTAESSALYRSETTTQPQSELTNGTGYAGAISLSTSLGGAVGNGTEYSGGASNGGSFIGGGGGESKAVFVSKATIPRVERSNSSGKNERSFEKTSETRFGNGVGGMSYSVTYQHSTVRNVSTLPRKPQANAATTSYAHVSDVMISFKFLRDFCDFLLISCTR